MVLKSLLLLNTGAETNIITYQIIENIILAKQSGLNLELISYINNNCSFFNLYWNVEVTI